MTDFLTRIVENTLNPISILPATRQSGIWQENSDNLQPLISAEWSNKESLQNAKINNENINRSDSYPNNLANGANLKSLLTPTSALLSEILPVNTSNNFSTEQSTKDNEPPVSLLKEEHIIQPDLSNKSNTNTDSLNFRSKKQAVANTVQENANNTQPLIATELVNKEPLQNVKNHHENISVSEKYSNINNLVADENIISKIAPTDSIYSETDSLIFKPNKQTVADTVQENANNTQSLITAELFNKEPLQNVKNHHEKINASEKYFNTNNLVAGEDIKSKIAPTDVIYSENLPAKTSNNFLVMPSRKDNKLPLSFLKEKQATQKYFINKDHITINSEDFLPEKMFVPENEQRHQKGLASFATSFITQDSKKNTFPATANKNIKQKKAAQTIIASEHLINALTEDNLAKNLAEKDFQLKEFSVSKEVSSHSLGQPEQQIMMPENEDKLVRSEKTTDKFDIQPKTDSNKIGKLGERSDILKVEKTAATIRDPVITSNEIIENNHLNKETNKLIQKINNPNDIAEIKKYGFQEEKLILVSENKAGKIILINNKKFSVSPKEQLIAPQFNEHKSDYQSFSGNQKAKKNKPNVKINIGRLEVNASKTAKQPSNKIEYKERARNLMPTLTLREYLNNPGGE